MSNVQKIKPYMRQAEEEMDHVAVIRDQVHQLLVETAARVAADDGAHQALLDALDSLSTAYKAMCKANAALMRKRAMELCDGRVS